MIPKPSILIVDDEKDIVQLIQYNLEKEGYQIHTASTGEEGFETAKKKRPQLIILDLMLPGIDGLEVCKLLRAEPLTKNIPVLMLTAKNTDVDQILGFELGASDYVSKPFSPKVLLVRIKNILKNRQTHKEDKVVLKAGELSLDKERQTFSVKGKGVALTRLEFKIIAFLMENPGKVFTRDQLLSGAWGQETFVVDRTVDVHVKSIRQKLGKYREAIETVRGSGYRFSEKSGS